MKKYLLNWKLAAIVIMAAILSFITLPSRYQPEAVTPTSIKDMKIVLGLDLQGGTQLDYKIDLRSVPEAKRTQIISGVQEVITRRVNKLGVSEPNIYHSQIADEDHIIVELAGVSDINEAKDRVGKTIQLEFKEQKTENSDAELEEVKKQTTAFLDKVKAPETDFNLLAEEEAKAFPNIVTFTEQDYKFKDEISGTKLADKIFAAAPGTIINEVIEDSAGFVYTNNQIQEQKGFFVVKVLDKKDAEKDISEPKKVKAQHILISYAGASKADGVTRTKEEAEKLAQEILNKAKAPGADFTALAKENSDEPGATESGGILEQEVVDGDSSYVEDFTTASLALTEAGQITDQLVKTEFGYHIIKAVSVSAGKDEKTVEPQVKYAQAFFSTIPNPWKETALTGEHFVSASVEFDNLLQPQVAIQFDSEGAQLFADLTEKNITKPIAIFVGGELISSPVVNDKITGGQAVITGNFTLDEAQGLARDLNTGAIPAPITLVGQYNIGSTLGQAALQKSLWAGLIGLILLSLYLVAYYRLPGLLSVIALAIYSTILLFVIKVSLPVLLAVIIGVGIGVTAVGTILKSKDSTAEKVVSIVIAIFALFFFTFLLREPVVLTLAGIAGVVLSIGMAVDANILIFERIKEEIRDGRPFDGAIDVGFRRAWSSIRDSNFSSLITCAILFYFGSSIIRGFALNLAAGILISMFTAITITYTFLKVYARIKGSDNPILLGTKPGAKTHRSFDIIGRSKVWFVLSSILILISLGSLAIRGLNPGIDFRGGTLMEIQFGQEQTVSKLDLETALTKLATEIDSTKAETTTSTNAATAGAETNEPQLVAAASTEPVEIGKPSVVESVNEAGEKSFIIRLGFIDTVVHDQINTAITAQFGEYKETRFTTIGPLISTSLKQKAIVALLFALIMIVLYIAFAFRNVPKSIGPWKFGASAIFALIHDVILVLGFFSLFQIEVDSLFITALLTIIGFSVHDTIVVFDRLRENLKEFKASEQTFDDVANIALNQTMARSLNTSISTLFTLVALVVLGAQSIFFFSLALTLGIIFGTYSSVFVASPILVFWKKISEK